MPIYEYQCQSCGHCFEKLVNLNDSPRQLPCPHCGDRQVERRLSRTVVFNPGKDGLCGPGAGGFS